MTVDEEVSVERATILVVDHCPETRQRLRRWLEQAGYGVVEANDADACLEMALRAPDLAVLEVGLPDRSGVELARQLRDDRRTASIPIIHRCAVRIDETAVIEGLRAGASQYLTEPVSPELLVAAIESLLRDRDRGRELEVALSLPYSGTFEWEIPTGFVRWSASLESLHGLEHGTFGSSFDAFLEHVHHDDEETVKATIGEALGGAGDYRILYRAQRADSSTFWLQASGRVFFSADGRPVRLLGFALDVTDREEALQRSTRLQRLAADLNAVSSVDEVMSQVRAVLDTLGGEVQRLPLADGNRDQLLQLTAPREATREDEAHIEAIADLATNAILRAERFDEERRHAEMLQHVLLPGAVRNIDGWRVDAEYRAPGNRDRLGGDFYDVFITDTHLTCVVGDVAGHGLAAVASMSSVRALTRVAALRAADPSELLREVSELIVHGSAGEDPDFVTMIVARVNRVSGKVEIASAGHPPPIVRRGDGRAEVCDVSPLPPLGWFGENRAQADHVSNLVLDPGDSLILMTDGVVERRDQPVDESLDGLARFVSGVVDAITPAVVLDRPQNRRANSDDRVVLCVGRENSTPAI